VPTIRPADPGIEPAVFADALGALTHITDDAFVEYGTTQDQITDMRRRFADWRQALRSA
jgi:hypothetical protein